MNAGPLLEGWRDCHVAAATEGWPLPAPALEEIVALVRHPGGPPLSRYELLLALSPTGTVLGGAEVWWMSGDNAHLVELDPVVHSASRRAGVGTALLSEVRAAAAAQGRRTLTSGAPVGSVGEAFGRATGRELATVDQRNVLRLDRANLPAEAPLAPGYRYESFVDTPPDALLEPLARCLDAMNDAPTGELDWTDEHWTGSRLAALYKLRHARDEHTWVLAAVSKATGEVAGLTEVVTSPWHASRADQGDTCVVPAHRGSGIGLALKTRMLRWLLHEEPELRAVETWNVDTNSPMLRVNHAMGFELAERWALMQWPVVPAP
jgi:GNAT superfamily N-acetyltransferase